MRGKPEIEIRRDAMAVTVCIVPDGAAEITEHMLRDALAARGVSAGIKEDVLREIADHGICNQCYVVAEGMPAVDGKSGYYEYFFRQDTKEFVPTIREDGSVDYSPTIHFVEKGSKVAEYHPARQGSPGSTVFGGELKPARGKELPPLVCKNVEKRDNGYYAKERGKISRWENRIEICTNLTIDGDAGYSMRTVDFNGDVVVKGDVLTDVVIRAGGDITVDGVVEGATLVTTGNIVVRHGVHGKGKAVLEAGGSVISNFIEKAKITAGGDIRVDYMANTQAYAKKTILATGKKGQIIGGEAFAGEAVDAYRIGNEMGTRTNISVDSEDAGQRMLAKIVVHKKLYERVELSINGVTAKRFPAFGEFHYVDGEMKVFEIGKFRPVQSEDTATTQEKKPLILLVDDDAVVLRTEYAYLCQDYRVATASSPQDAMRYLKRYKPDLVLLDYLMPQMNGGKLLEQIRKDSDKKVADVAVFFVTNTTDKRIVTECLKLCPQGYLVKPLKKDELLKTVAGYFAKKEKRT